MSDTFSLDGRTYPHDRPVDNIVLFCVMMSAVVARKRGGRNSDYLPECADFMVEVVGRRLSVADALPAEFDWRPSAAIECANALLEYDDA